jgi:hypothetical protein
VISSTGYKTFVVVTVESTVVVVKVVVVVNVDMAVCVTVLGVPPVHPVRDDVQIIRDIIMKESSFFIPASFFVACVISYIYYNVYNRFWIVKNKMKSLPSGEGGESR